MSKVLIFLIFVLSAVAVTGQEAQYPFPQNVTYPNGYMPTTLSTKDCENWYSRFKSSNFMQSCNGGYAPRTDNGTKVEAMGWAMILAAYMADKDLFDGLYTFYKSKIQRHGMMAWLTSCGGVSDAGSATDGDLDVAFSFCVAAWQWGDSYREEAIKIINTVEKLITKCGDDVSILYPGYGGHGGPYGGCNETDISYYTPAFFRVFAEFTENDAWEKLADDTYIVLNNAANDKTGLVPDWHTWQGGRAGSRNYSYGYDACRVPWRITLDYLWNGNEKAKEWCTTIAEWANGVGAGNLKGSYNTDGSGGGAWPAMSFVGGFAVSTMAHSQEVVDAFGKQIAGMNYDNYWYHAYLGNMYLLTMTGNMWRPGLTVSNKAPVKGLNRSESFSVKMGGKRKLILSGIRDGDVVRLTTLAGELVRHIPSIKGCTATLDVSSMRSGCYILSIADHSGKAREGRVVSIY